MTPEAAAEAALAAMRRGNLLTAYDIAERGLHDAPDDLELKYLSVLALARSGATELASQRFEWLGLGGTATAQGHLGVDIPATKRLVSAVAARVLPWPGNRTD